MIFHQNTIIAIWWVMTIIDWLLQFKFQSIWLSQINQISLEEFIFTFMLHAFLYCKFTLFWSIIREKFIANYVCMTWHLFLFCKYALIQLQHTRDQLLKQWKTMMNLLHNSFLTERYFNLTDTMSSYHSRKKRKLMIVFCFW